MKNSMLISTMAGLVALAGCSNRETQEGTPTPPPSTNAAKSAAQTVSPALGQIGQAKDQAVAAIEMQLRALDSKIDELSAKTSSLAGDAKAEGEKALTALRAKRDDVTVRLRDLKAASQDAWQNVKTSFDLALQELEQAYDELKAKLNG